AGRAAAAAHRDLTTGQSIRFDGPGLFKAIPLNPAAFLTAQELARRWLAQAQLRQRNWATASAALRRDPGLLLYYTFQPEETWSRTLPDQAAGRPRPHDGAIVGCSWGTGRWPGKQALEFHQVSDRVRFHV